MNTRTGNVPIGFRRGGTNWQKDITSLLKWTTDNNLSVIDIGKDADKIGKQIQDAGVKIGTVDLQEWHGMISADKGEREKALAANVAQIEANAKLGPINYFIVMLPKNPEAKRSDNFGYMVESFNKLAPTLEKANAKIVVEGWPGPGALVCTPEGYRAFFEQVPSKSMAVNFDPSHLLRMGIDPLRFLNEFVGRVAHVHGKDTELLSEGLYEYGHEQPPTFGKPRPFGGMSWRYTIPGHGQTRWNEVFRILSENNYKGAVCIELEDANFNGPDESEKIGVLQGAWFLEGI